MALNPQVTLSNETIVMYVIPIALWRSLSLHTRCEQGLDFFAKCNKCNSQGSENSTLTFGLFLPCNYWAFFSFQSHLYLITLGHFLGLWCGSMDWRCSHSVSITLFFAKCSSTNRYFLPINSEIAGVILSSHGKRWRDTLLKRVLDL
jgi:hypothetical protein